MRWSLFFFRVDLIVVAELSEIETVDEAVVRFEVSGRRRRRERWSRDVVGSNERDLLLLLIDRTLLILIHSDPLD